MKELSAVRLRRSMEKVARSLEKGGPPVVLTFRGRPVGAIVSMKDFRERFGPHDLESERPRVVAQIRAHARRSTVRVDDVLAEVRGR